MLDLFRMVYTRCLISKAKIAVHKPPDLPTTSAIRDVICNAAKGGVEASAKLIINWLNVLIDV